MNNVCTLLRPPGQPARRERRAYPVVVCKERATQPAGLRASAHRGTAAGARAKMPINSCASLKAPNLTLSMPERLGSFPIKTRHLPSSLLRRSLLI